MRDENSFGSSIPQDKLRILVTGFEPFGGAPHNPSGDVARALHGQTIGEGLVFGRVLPVLWDIAPRLLESWLEELRPNVVVALGMAHDAITLELRATNRRHPERRDNNGCLPVPPRPVATKFLTTALPVEAIKQALAHDGLRFSEDAGGFLCEEVFYALLSVSTDIRAAKRWPLFASGFVHVPNDRFIADEPARKRLERQIRRIIETTLAEGRKRTEPETTGFI